MKEKNLIIKLFFKILIIISITETFIMALFFHLNVSKFLQIILDPISIDV